jgi:hypothetical protein
VATSGISIAGVVDGKIAETWSEVNRVDMLQQLQGTPGLGARTVFARHRDSC